jgi:hypothetical protein
MKHTLAFSLAVCTLAIVVAASGEALAARKASKDSPLIPAKGSIAGQPAVPQAKPALAGRASKPAAVEAPSSKRKSHRPIKASKKTVSKAVVQPRTDLTHYGILENSQRYDPRPPADSVGVPHPQALDLTHDHFQELDRNQDGKIDPVERAFGRIDMDRDLHTRTLQ